MYPELKENRPHGTDDYPYTQYHMHHIFHAFQIPVHWPEKNTPRKTVLFISLLRGSFI